MTAYVFVGPTLTSGEARAACDVVCLPPVAQGDVYRAVQTRPRAIGIIDGYFEGVPSVWHKEILWAMSRGVHVFGSASMGALRAAELHVFGMRGVGRIFEAYRDGDLEDDDEVAVLHGPAETGFVALSEPMVNIRATLERAAAEGIVSPATRQTLEDRAKDRFYQQRDWEELTDSPPSEGSCADEIRALLDWLPTGRVDLKRNDALEMLAEMQELLAGNPGPSRVTYNFEWTELWDNATAFSAGVKVNPADEMTSLPIERLLEELRLEASTWNEARLRALFRFLALREADRRRLRVHDEALSETINRFRSGLGLFSRQDLDQWLEQNDIDLVDFERLMVDEARLEALRFLTEPALEEHLLADLRVDGRYARLADRARCKQRVLASIGLDDPKLRDAGLTPAQLLAWYFETRLGQPMPDDIDAFAQGLGFASKSDFYRVLLREYLYVYLPNKDGGAQVS